MHNFARIVIKKQPELQHFKTTNHKTCLLWHLQAQRSKTFRWRGKIICRKCHKRLLKMTPLSVKEHMTSLAWHRSLALAGEFLHENGTPAVYLSHHLLLHILLCDGAGMLVVLRWSSKLPTNGVCSASSLGLKFRDSICYGVYDFVIGVSGTMWLFVS